MSTEDLFALAGKGPMPLVERGTCYVFFAYDVGLAIKLDAAEALIAADKQRESIKHKRRAPYYFEYQPPPLRVTYPIDPVLLGNRATEPTVDAVVYDFGAISVQYSIPLAGPLPALRTLSDALYANADLLAASRRVVEELAVSLRPAITKPEITSLVEDYCVYQLAELSPAVPLEALLREHRMMLAQILRAEGGPLSAEEVADALGCQIAFGPDDQTLIDWNAALLVDRDADDVRAVLEYANVELLEMRYLDDRLDAALEEIYGALGRRAGSWGVFFGSRAEDLRRIAELQTDSAVLYEGVNNALKLLGDQYLARVHRLVSQRFHLNDWDRSIRRKLETIESIYEKLSDRQATHRLEVLEWIIILLIAAGIVLPFVPGFYGH